jgi:hypothetical protein
VCVCVCVLYKRVMMSLYCAVTQHITLLLHKLRYCTQLQGRHANYVQTRYISGSSAVATVWYWVLEGSVTRFVNKACSKSSLCTLRLQHRKLKVMFKVSPASLQTFIDTRLTLTPSVILNSNYVIMVSDLNYSHCGPVFFPLYLSQNINSK